LKNKFTLAVLRRKNDLLIKKIGLTFKQITLNIFIGIGLSHDSKIAQCILVMKLIF